MTGLRPFWSFLCALALGVGTAQANDAEFEERVRRYLLDNPEVILEALEGLAAREAAAEMRSRIARFADLFEAPPVHGLGRADAPVRVVEFFDYKCAPCKAMHPALVALVDAHPDLRIEMRHLPILSPGSERAARFALATRAVAGDQAYGAVHDRLWSQRGVLNSTTFERIAGDLGLDFAAIADAMDSPDITARIDYNRDAAIALDILGTPAFVTPESVRFGQSDVAGLATLWLGAQVSQ